MALKLNITSLSGIDSRRNNSSWVILVKFKRNQVFTHEVCAHHIDPSLILFNQVLELKLQKSLRETDFITLNVMEVMGGKVAIRHKVGEFSMILQSVLNSKIVFVEQQILDSINNSLLQYIPREFDQASMPLLSLEEPDHLMTSELDEKSASVASSGSGESILPPLSVSGANSPSMLPASCYASPTHDEPVKEMTGDVARSTSQCTLQSQRIEKPPAAQRSLTLPTASNVHELEADIRLKQSKVLQMFRRKAPSEGDEKSNSSPKLKRRFRMAANVAKILKRRKEPVPPPPATLTYMDEPDAHEEVVHEEIEATCIMEEPEAEDSHPYARKSKLSCLKRVLQPSKQNISLDYQIGITVIEIRKLQGLNMNPMVEIHVGDDKRKTSCKEATNCPFYDEYFVFDYNLPTQALLEKIITFTVYSSSTFTKGKRLAQFKIEVAAVHAFPGHQVYHKWAPLMGCGEEQMTDDIKGYMQCDIAITGKDSSRPLADLSKNNDPDNFEKNLLLPPGTGHFERQKARIQVKVYRAEDLPYMNIGILANMKKAFTGERADLVDPYVQVSFAGLKLKTSVKKGQCSPVWNEELTFTEALPALCSTVQIQLKDKNSVTDDVIGTYYIDLMNISNTGTMGFLPTFGPCWVNLYGSNRDVNVLDEHRNLNSGQGEGIAYRGRLLIAINTEALSGTSIIDETSESAEIHRITAVPENALPKKKDFLLIGSLFEATNINGKFKNQPVQFEISIGNLSDSNSFPDTEYKEIQRHDSTLRIPVFDSNDSTSLIDRQTEAKLHSDQTHTTAPRIPSTHDKNTFYVHFEEKPCLFVQTRLEDTCPRMFSQNLTEHLADNLAEGIADVKHLMSQGDLDRANSKLTRVIHNFALHCMKCSDEWKHDGSSSTRLDKERRRVCKLKLEYMSSRARTIKNTLTLNNMKEKLRQAHDILNEVHKLSQEPQDCFPDVFIWMLVAGKRIAYFRLPARDILYSDVDIKNGKWCGKLNTLLLKLPGKRSAGSSGWQMQAQLSMMLWLGFFDNKDVFMKSLPPGYTSQSSSVPRSLSINNEEKYQLRAHLYQARALIGSDSSGLSDPYAIISFGDHSATTKVIYETLSPTWNQMLIIDDIRLPFPGRWMKQCPPMITIELYDQDSIGSPEYLGRTFAFPLIKLCNDKYVGPTFPALLQWWHIMRGQSASGELLASFELFEKPFDPAEIYKVLLTPRLIPRNRRNAVAGMGMDVSSTDIQDALAAEKGAIVPIPGSIRPIFSKHRIEVLFWGVRELKKLQFTSVTKPRIDVECAGHVISSTPIVDANENPNFSVTVMHTDVDLPEDQTYCPPITIRCVDCRNFGRFVLVGTHAISSLQKYLYETKAKRSYDNLIAREPATESSIMDPSTPVNTNVEPSPGAPNNIQAAGFQLINKTSEVLDQSQSISSGLKNLGMEITGFNKRAEKRQKESAQQHTDAADDIDWASLDWWSKYYASVDKHEHSSPAHHEEHHDEEITYSINENGITELITKRTDDHAADEVEGSAQQGQPSNMTSSSSKFKHIQTLKIYDRELEAVKEFSGFADWLHTFSLYRGKKTTDDEDDDYRLVGKFKIYKIPALLGPADINIVGGDPKQGMFAGVPSNGPVKVLVRVYIVLAKELHPADLNGKADPYLIIKIGNKIINDAKNYVPKQLNPIFGRCFEQEVTFPLESQLCVQVMDWDLLSKDDLIGETKVDLENRYYSRHRATCGLHNVYHSTGYNAWRDREKPTLILAKLCKQSHVEPLHYRLPQAKVTVGGRDFFLKEDDASHMEENLALEALKHWDEIKPAGCFMVPEHVETRSLYNPEKPGVEQGKLQMWIDMFPLDAPAIPKPVDISPRKPVGYELRVTVWNTDEVILEEDDFFTGEKSSDIYVKGWLTGPDNSQSTDVHYRSLTGEGNFNWRFVLPFEYLLAEQKLVVKKKESVFSWDESETKMPAKLSLQVWDADHISADDFLGSFSADLTRFPRGSKTMESCVILDSSIPTVNLFKQKRIKGWWPFETDSGEIAGKVEAEIELLTSEDAEQRPVGEGRNAPEPLEKPNRPDTAFLWFLNPLKSMKYLFCKRYKMMFVKLVIGFLIALLLVLLIYNIPGYTAKKILGA